MQNGMAYQLWPVCPHSFRSLLQWITYTPEGTFPVVSDSKQYAAMIQQQGGDQALQQWRQLEDKLRPLQQGAALFPAAALRGDLGEPAGCRFARKVAQQRTVQDQGSVMLHGAYQKGLIVAKGNIWCRGEDVHDLAWHNVQQWARVSKP